MPAISKTGLEVAGQMTEEQFRAEKLYYISLSIAYSHSGFDCISPL